MSDTGSDNDVYFTREENASLLGTKERAGENKQSDKFLSSQHGWSNRLKFYSSPQFKVYASQFLSSWSERMWEFAEGLFLIQITPGSLRLVAIYNLAISLTVIVFGSTIGRWVDRKNRFSAIKISSLIQNVMISLCAIVLCILVAYESIFTENLNGWPKNFMEVAAILTACAAMIGNTASKLAIQKDWIVVLSKGNESFLATLNSVLRSVDLSTQIMAPILVGAVMAAFGIIFGGIMIASWNFISVIIQFYLLRSLYNSNADLRKPKLSDTSGVGTTSSSNLVSKIQDAVYMWKKFFLHHIKYAGLALAFLYMTVISFDNYTVAYLYESGMSKWLLGIMAGCASVAGILGAISFTFLHKWFGLLKTGVLGFSSELFCLGFCVLAMFAPGTVFDPKALFTAEAFFPGSSLIPSGTATPKEVGIIIQEPDAKMDNTSVISVILLLIGIITSRFGLWVADLTVTQVLQEDVMESERGGINGVQYSINQSFSLIRSALLIILPSLATFGYLVILSFLFVATATILFCIFARSKRRLYKQIKTGET